MDYQSAMQPQDTLLPVATNEQLDAEEQQRRDALNGVVGNRPYQDLDALAAHCWRVWTACKDAKIEIEERLLQCQRQRQGEYEPEDLAAIHEAGGCDIWMNVTSIKCRSIEAALNDAILPAGERPFQIEPTPVPDLGPGGEQIIAQRVMAEVQMLMQQGFQPSQEQINARIDEIREYVEAEQKKEARAKAERQEDLIDDIFVEGGFYDALRAFIKDYTTYPAAFLAGPEVRKRRRLVWAEDEHGPVPVPGEKIVREYECLSPFDVYPGPGSRSLDDGPLCIRRRMRRKDLLACHGVPGFDSEAIEAALDEYGIGGLDQWLWTDQERSRLEGREHEETDPEAVIDVVEIRCSVPGWMLAEWGTSPGDVVRDYDARMWLIGPHVVMARVNPHPLGRRPIYRASWEETNNSVWGKGPPEIIRDCQRVCNAAARAAVDNMALAAMPQVDVVRSRIEGSETDPESIYGGKVWQTKESAISNANNPAVRFFQPRLISGPLMEIFERFYQQAGEQLGVPAYDHGSTEVKGAGETASGLSMLLAQSNKVMKDAIRHIDNGVISPAAEETWLHLVLYDAPEDAGDIHVVARASEYMLVYERLQQFRGQWLQLTANPVDMQIIGLAGRAEVLREQAKQLRMPVDDIIPSRKEIEQRIAMMKQQQAAEQERQRQAMINQQVQGTQQLQGGIAA